MLSPHLVPMYYIDSYIHTFFLYGGPKYVGSQVCTKSLHMYVGYTNSFSIHFFCTIDFLCMQVEQNIRNVNILFTCADNRNDDETSTFMDGGPLNRGRGPDLTACLVGLRSFSRSNRGSCSTRMGPKYVGSSVCTESLRMYVGYTNIKFLCMQVEQNIRNVNILLTCATNRNDDETLTFMDGGLLNCRRGPDLTACLV